MQFSLKAQELKKQGRNIVSLGLGEPEFDTPEHIKQAASEALAAGLTRYSSAAGLTELRELVAKKLRVDNGIDAHPDEIIITPGAKNALFLACAAILRPGDEIINFTPCYVSNFPILKLAEPNCIVHNVPHLLHDLSIIDEARVRALINKRTRLILINYPNNPSGKMLTQTEAEFLREIISSNDIYLLSDEIYERIVFGHHEHISPASFDNIKHKVITVSGFSKAYSMTGWRIGHAHANADLISIMVKIHQQLNTNTAAFIQKAAVAALNGPQDHLIQFIDNLRQRKKLYEDMLVSNDHLNGSHPEGGFFAFLNISATDLSSDEFCTRLLEETDVAVIPGISFGLDFDDYCRVSLVNHTRVVAEGLNRISEFARKTVKNR